MVSRSKDIFPLGKMILHHFGVTNVWGTTLDGDALTMIINDEKPSLIFMESSFYWTATPYMIGMLLHTMPYLRIAVFNLGDYPARLEPKFIRFGAESYITLRNGIAEFYRGIRLVLQGKPFIAGTVDKQFETVKDTMLLKPAATDRELAVMLLLADGLTTQEIKDTLKISFRTVENHKKHIFARFQVRNTVQMIRTALISGTLRINEYTGVTDGTKEQGRGIPDRE
jgi:DNA-binding NarL/FixJ family response regulator